MKLHLEFVATSAILVTGSSAHEQGVTIASSRVEASAEVRIVGDETDRLLISSGGLTFALSLRDDGQLTLAIAGASGAVRPDGASATTAAGLSLSGSADGREIVSLSVAGRDFPDDGRTANPQDHLRGDHLRVVIANFT
jgi:hypothetical protein